MSQLWDAALRAQTALSRQFRPATERINKEIGLEPSVWNQLPTALSYEPETLSVDQIQKRNPYTASQRIEQQLETLKAHSLVTSNEGKEYRLTNEGRSRAQFILQTQRSHHTTVQPMPSADMTRLAELLKLVVTAVEKAPLPPGTWCLKKARQLKPDDSATPTTHADHYLGCLNAFRDDSHLAAWRTLDVNGPAWEAFTLIWRSEAKDAGELSEKLAFRGHGREMYDAALEQVAAKGWVAKQLGGYVVTEQGRALRDQVEATTDKYFEGSYSLSEVQSAELSGLFERLHST